MESVKNKRLNIYLIMVLFVFATVQFLVIVYYGENWYLGNFATMNNDDVKYIRSAWTLLDKHIFVYHDVNEPTAFIMPGYPLLIAFFMKVFGRVDGIIAIRFFQGLLQVASLYLVFRICKEMFNNKIALIAVILNTLYLPEMVSAVLILTETVFKFLLVALVYVSIKAIKNKNISYYFVGGIIWGLAILIRPTILLYPIVIFIMWIVFKYSIKEMIVRSLLVLCIGITLLSPWVIRNFIEFSRFIPLTLSSGNPFLQGTYINYDQTEDYTSYEFPSDAIERDKIEMDTGIKRLKQNFIKKPFSYIYWYTVGKSYYFWNVPFYYKNVFGIPFFIMHIFHIILIVFALGNLILFRADFKKETLLLLLIILYFNIMHLPYFTCSRYAYPIMPFVIIFASNAFINILRKFRMGKLGIEYSNKITLLL
jgi:4-amino-4-deoxy-L-arabinose transferase-like glycosyltransferase